MTVSEYPDKGQKCQGIIVDIREGIMYVWLCHWHADIIYSLDHVRLLVSSPFTTTRLMLDRVLIMSGDFRSNPSTKGKWLSGR